MPQSRQEGINIVGPKEGYSPQIGTLVSMMDRMRNINHMPIRDMSVDDLDYLVDNKANSIGAMLMHLAFHFPLNKTTNFLNFRTIHHKFIVKKKLLNK